LVAGFFVLLGLVAIPKAKNIYRRWGRMDADGKRLYLLALCARLTGTMPVPPWQNFQTDGITLSHLGRALYMPMAYFCGMQTAIPVGLILCDVQFGPGGTLSFPNKTGGFRAFS
jgi:hypothetical protein